MREYLGGKWEHHRAVYGRLVSNSRNDPFIGTIFSPSLVGDDPLSRPLHEMVAINFVKYSVDVQLVR